MRRKRLATGRPRIDKSALTFGEPTRIRDDAYRTSAKHRNCDVCALAGRIAAPGTVVLAHINRDGNSGTGLKASDDSSLFLCATHHAEFDTATDRDAWLVDNLVIPMRLNAYRSSLQTGHR